MRSRAQGAGADDAAQALATWVAPERGALRAAGVLQAAATGARGGQAAGVAGVTQAVLDGRTGLAPTAPWVALVLAAGAAHVALTHAAVRSADAARARVTHGLRHALLDRILAARQTGQPSGALSQILIDEAERIGAYAARFEPDRLSALLGPLLVAALVAPVSWPIASLLVLCTPLIPLNVSLVGMGTASVSRRHQHALRSLSSFFVDRLTGLPTLQRLGAATREAARVDAAAHELARRTLSVMRVAFVSSAVIEAIITVAVAMVATLVGLTLLGFVHVAVLPGTISLRAGLFGLMLTPVYFTPIRRLVADYHERTSALTAAETILTVLDRRVIAPGPEPIATPASSVGIAIHAVTVTYPHRARPALESLILSIKEGALVGVSGASGPASQRCCASSPAPYLPTKARFSSRDTTPRAWNPPPGRGSSPGSGRTRTSSDAPCTTTSRWHAPRQPPMRSLRPPLKPV